MPLLLIIGFLLLSPGFTAQAPDPIKPEEPPRLRELKEKAERMEEHQRGRAYSEVVLELAEVANQQFNEGELEKGQSSIKELVQYADKSFNSARLKNKKIKDTEINLRKAARRLEEIQRTLALDDQPPVKAAVERLDALRKDLLEHMFKKKS
jgi:hypothetical protein